MKSHRYSGDLINAKEHKADRLAEMREQLDAGTLVVRHATSADLAALDMARVRRDRRCTLPPLI